MTDTTGALLTFAPGDLDYPWSASVNHGRKILRWIPPDDEH